MQTLSHHTHFRQGPHHHSLYAIVESLRNRWTDYRLMREIESVPFDVLKDVGYPAADEKNEK